MPSTPDNGRFVLGDWGTSRLRLSLLENDVVTDSREGPGIGVLTGTVAATLSTTISPWLDSNKPLEVLLSGMVGSRNGLLEVPYATAPVDMSMWGKAAARTQLQGMDITIATGLRTGKQDGAPDVMRGEETQIFGAMQIDATLAIGSHLLVLPGTHCKWVFVNDGAITRFRTALTGEVYALLREHSTLLKAGKVDGDATADTAAGFEAGMKRSLHLTEGLLAALFETRTAQLLEQRSRAWGSGFLSALLIGYEIASLSPAYSAAGGVTVIGDQVLAAAYARIFENYGTAVRLLSGTDCALAGLHCLRRYTREN